MALKSAIVFVLPCSLIAERFSQTAAEFPDQPGKAIPFFVNEFNPELPRASLNARTANTSLLRLAKDRTASWRYAPLAFLVKCLLGDRIRPDHPTR